MNGKAKKAAAPRKKANGYKMPAPIPIGEVITDTIGKKKWRIGPSIGVGGFGEIYSACEHDSSPKKGAYYPYVIKIEPHENGPLFVEKHFYLRNANKDDIAKFMKTKKLSTFGMPLYYGNGSHDYKGEKYRYLVLERYGKDLWSLFLESGRTFPTPTIFQIGLQMLDVLEYIHGKGYVHADIKGANILLGLKKGTENQTYLVDFGLATRVNEKEFKPDPKCAHNGTIEYTSRDAHLGVATMRGDLEILGYNMLQWLAGALPWERVLKQPKAVQEQKEAFMKNVRIEARKLANIPEALIKFLEYINTLKPKDPVDYAKCRQFFESYLKSEGKTKTSKLEFTTKKQKASKAVIKVDDTEDSTDSPIVVKKKKSKDDNQTKPKRGRKAKEDELTIDNEDVSSVKKVKKAKAKESEPTINNEEVNDAKKGRKAKAKVEPTIDSEEANDECENEEPDYSIEIVPRKPRKRKSVEPSVVVNVKKTKMAPRATPPAKNNHAHTATQTSGGRPRRSPRRSPRQVSFDSPICEVLGERPDQKASPNTSADIFEDSFVEDKKVKKKRRLLADREVTVKRTVIKKVTTTTVKPKARSYKDCPTIVNGRSPPK